MKLRLFAPGGNLVDIDFDPSVTGAKASEILANTLKLKDTNFEFIHHGKILQSQAPFDGLPQGSRVIYRPKAIAPPPPPIRIVQSENPNQAEDSPEGEAPHQEPRQNQELIQQLTPQIERFIQVSQLEALYEPENEIWRHPAELQSMASLISQNPSNLVPFYYHDYQHPVAPQVDPGVALSNVFAILDAPLTDFVPPSDPLDVAIEDLSNEQRKKFDEIVKRGVDPRCLISILIDNNYDFAKTEEALK